MSVPIKGMGKAILPNSMKLNNVLYIPDFICNLVFVSKLTKEHNCAIIFIVDLCIIQDLPSRTQIGMGRHQNGLYIIEPKQGGGIAMKTNKSNAEL